MSETCIICSHNQADTYCIPCSSLFCAQCSSFHVNWKNSSHQLINYQVFLHQNESHVQNKKNTMKNVSSWLKDRLVEANLQVDAHFSEVLQKIREKQQFLHSLVDKIFIEKAQDQAESFEINEKALELMAKGKNLVNRQIITQQDVESFVFGEIISPGVSQELETALFKELNYNLEIYPTSKPVPLYSFKANSSQVFMFDILTEEEVIMNVKNFECKSCAAWCLFDSKIIYTGGWKLGYSSFEVFEINTSNWSVVPRPPLVFPRHQHSTIFADGNVFVFGGAGKIGLLSTCEKWKLFEEKWTVICNLPNPITQMGICNVGKFIFLSGGVEVERYSILKDCFFRLPVRFDGRVLSTLVQFGNNILIFRPGELWEYENEEGIIYKKCDLDYIDLWSSTHPVLRLGKIYFFLETLRIVYAFDISKKKLEFVTDFQKSDSESQ